MVVHGEIIAEGTGGDLSERSGGERPEDPYAEAMT